MKNQCTVTPGSAPWIEAAREITKAISALVASQGGVINCGSVETKITECIRKHVISSRLISDQYNLLEWLDENAAELVAESSPIADTGDYSTVWVVYEHHGYPGGKPKRVPLGYGETPVNAIRDAMLMLDDPEKWNHVSSLPNAKISPEAEHSNQ